MFSFLKKKKQQPIEWDENAFKACEEESAAFFKADEEAQEKAGLKGKLGSYTFICPNCGSKCTGEWVRFDALGNRHGSTGCNNCHIHLIV